MYPVKSILFSLFVLLSLHSCKKADYSDTHISGRVVDADTKQPISGMKMNLEYLDGGTGMGLLDGSYTIGTTMTDNNGYYSFGFVGYTDNTHGDRYRLSGYQSPSYFGVGAELSVDSGYKKSVQLNLEAYRQVYIKVHLVHSGPNNSADLISLSVSQNLPVGGGQYLEYGNATEVVETMGVVPGHPTYFEHYAERSGVFSAKQVDTVTFTKDGEDFTIQY